MMMQSVKTTGTHGQADTVRILALDRCNRLRPNEAAPQTMRRQRPAAFRRRPARAAHLPHIVCAATAQKQAAPAAATAASWYRHQSSLGAGVQVVTAVEKTSKGFVVTITIPAEAAAPGTAPHIIWGVYRTSPAKWFHPKGSVPQGSEAAGRGMRSPMAADSGGGATIQLTLGAELAPVTLAFTVALSADGDTASSRRTDSSVTARGGAPFAVPIGMQPGSPFVLGPSIRAGSDPAGESAVNFCVRSGAATSVSLCLLRTGGKGGYLEIALDPVVNRTGDAWHVLVEGMKDVGSLAYGWRADAADISRFYPGQVMLDPYCRAITRVTLPDGVQTVAPNIAKARGGAGAGDAVLGALACLVDAPDWGGAPRQRPRRLPQDDIVLEVDVASFTDSDQVAAERRGKMLGVLDRLQHIRETGATSVLLTPLAASSPGVGPHGQAPQSFFAPEPGLAVAADALGAARELRRLVAGLHAAGLSVLLQVQFCFTAEGGRESRNPSSFLGLDSSVYYRSDDVLNCGHAAVRRLVVDSLRHWAADFRIDGFCFLNADALTHDRDGTVLDAPPLAHEIAVDPLLADRRLLAAPGRGDLLPRGGAHGFPHWAAWSERNARFSTDIVRFLAEGAGGENLQAAAECLAGSPAVFDTYDAGGLPGNLAAGRPPAAGLNGVTRLGGDPWRSLRKTVDDSLWSFPPHQDAAQGCASHQDAFAKSLLVAALLSRGTPCLTQDEVGEQQLARFVGEVAAVRRRYTDLLQPRRFAAGPPLVWHGAYPGTEPDWDGSQGGSPGCNFLAFSVADGGQRALYVGFNNSGGTEGVALPPPPAATSWHQVVDTGRPSPHDAVAHGGTQLSGPDYYMQPKSALVLEAVPHPQQPPATAGSQLAVE